MTAAPAPIASWPRRVVQRGRVDHDEAPHAVYSLYDAADQLIYVGLSHNPEHRIRVHLGRPWGHEVCSWSADWYRNRDEGAQAEAALIQDFLPRHNTYGTPRQGMAIRAANRRIREMQARNTADRRRRHKKAS